MLRDVTLVLIAAGGAAGAVTRHLVDNAVIERFPGAFPFGILVVNLSGAFVLGLLAALIIERGLLPPDLRSPLIIGFLGAYTTFSTLMLDSWRLVEDGLPVLAVAAIAGSMVIGILAVVGGLLAGSLARLIATKSTRPDDGVHIVACPLGDTRPSGDPSATRSMFPMLHPSTR